MAAKKKTQKKTVTTNQKIGIGVGLTAAAVAAAGAYFLAGAPDAKKNRAKVKSWMLKAKAEVLEGLEKAEEMTEEEFNQLVMAVGSTYSKLKDASRNDIAEFKREMKASWPKIVNEGKKVAKKSAKKTAKKVAKKTAKKVTKKSAKKTSKKK